MAELRIIGHRYEMGGLLGQGGMATVYRGRDTLTDEPVAIKLLRSETIAREPGLVERFAREGEALRRLNHPNIVKMLATIQEDSEHFVVMEYVGGGDLRTLLDEYRERGEMMSIPHVMDIALDLSDALTRAHRLKIIHRDIKPGNVLLAADGTPRLTDFGVAHMGDSARLTQTGAMIGTLSYLSPEVCIGEEADTGADIWAFGVMLYEMLTLRRPFDGPNTAAVINSIMYEHAESLVELRPDTPPELVTVVEQMLIKDPEQRTSSVRLIGAQLEAIIGGKRLPGSGDITPTPTGSDKYDTVQLDSDTGEALRTGARTEQRVVVEEAGARQVQPARSNRTLMFGGIAAVLIVLALLAAAALVLSNQPGGGDSSGEIALVAPVPEDKYMVLVAEIERVSGDVRDVTRFIFEDLTAKFEEDVPFSDIRVRRYPEVITTGAGAQEIAEANNAAIIVWGYYDSEGINIEMQLGSLDDFPELPFSRKDLESLTNVRIRMTNERRESLAASVVAIINVLHYAAENTFELGANLALLEVVRPTKPEVLGNSVAARWHRYLAAYSDDITQSLEEISAAIALDASQPILYLGRGQAYLRVERIEAAIQDIRTAERLGPEAWQYPYMSLGQIAFFLQDNPDQAREYLDRAVAGGMDDWSMLTLRGLLYYLAGDFDTARADLEQALAANPSQNLPYLMSAAIALREGQLIEAMDLFNTVQERFPDPTFAARVLRSVYAINSEDDPWTAAVAAFGNFTLEQWNSVIALTDQAVEQGAADIFPDLYVLRGIAYCNLGDYEAAEDSYTHLLEIDPDYTLANILRMQVRAEQSKTTGALADVAAVMRSPQASAYMSFLPLLREGEIDCSNMLDLDVSAFMEATPTPQPE